MNEENISKSIKIKQTSKLSVVAMILGIISLFPYLLGIIDYIPLVRSYYWNSFITWIDMPISLFFFAPAGIIAFSLGLYTIIKIRRKKQNIKGFGFAVVGLIGGIYFVLGGWVLLVLLGAVH